jgi:predicted dehydrogenase
MTMNGNLDRRTVLKSAAAGLACPAVMTNLARAAPSTTIRIAGIGAGGKGFTDLRGVAQSPHVEVVALCDVDHKQAKRTFKAFPNARVYTDYRKMLDEIGGQLDAVTVSTPDHTHAPITMRALQQGLHAFTQKPLTHTVQEARALRQAAWQHNAITQMGIQRHNQKMEYRATVAQIQDGAIGQVKEAHVWTDRPGKWWDQGMAEPSGQSGPIPETLNWDLWLGPARTRPYLDQWQNGPHQGKTVYLPEYWRRWYDFGTGALGDMACHNFDPVYNALELTAPYSVRFEGTDVPNGGFPKEETITWMFPGTRYTAGDTLKVCWYDGGRKPAKTLLPAESRDLDLPKNGILLIGTEGVMLTGRGGWPDLLPQADFADYKEQFAKNTDLKPLDHYLQWINAIRGEDRAKANFDYAGPLTECVLLGVIASRVPDKTLQWDATRLRIPNDQTANAEVTKAYRKGFSAHALGERPGVSA